MSAVFLNECPLKIQIIKQKSFCQSSLIESSRKMHFMFTEISLLDIEERKNIQPAAKNSQVGKNAN